MKTARIIAVAVLMVGSALALHVAWAQQAAFKRTALRRHDLSALGREVVQGRVAIGFEGVAPLSKRKARP